MYRRLRRLAGFVVETLPSPPAAVKVCEFVAVLLVIYTDTLHCLRTLQQLAITIVSSPLFELFSMLVVIATAISLGFEQFEPSAELWRNLLICNIVLTICFAVDVLIRWIAAGAAYWTFGSNVAEVGLLAISLLDVSLALAGAPDGTYNLRSLRGLRIMRLALISNGWMRVVRRIVDVSVTRGLFTIFVIALRCTIRISQAVPVATASLAITFVVLATFAVVGMQVRSGFK